MLPLPPAVRWCLDMSLEAEVHDAQAAALRLQQEYGMQEVKDVTQENGQTSFLLCVATPAHSIVGPDAVVTIRAYSAKPEWEAEIGAVIGRRAHNVTADAPWT